VQPRYTSQRSYTRTTSSDRFRRPFWQW
jgi:hypothetical protein